MPDRTTPDRDQWISAYLDGALDQAGMAAFEAALETDPALAADMARLVENDSLLRAAFDPPMQTEPDDALLARMGLTEPLSPAPVAANDNPPFWRGWRLTAASAMAAALALAVTLSLPGDQAPMPFGRALDATASGEVAVLEGGAELTPLLTFAAADGRFCREFSLGGATSSGNGIACRQGPGSWQVEALDPAAARLADSTQIVLASGASSGALEAAYDRLNAGDPLTREREQSLISSDWRQGG